MFRIWPWKSSSNVLEILAIAQRVRNRVVEKFSEEQSTTEAQQSQEVKAAQTKQFFEAWRRIVGGDVKSHEALHEALKPFKETSYPGDIDSKVLSAICEYGENVSRLRNEVDLIAHKFATSGKYLTIFDPGQLGEALVETITDYAKKQKIDLKKLIEEHGGEETLVDNLLGVIKSFNTTEIVFKTAKKVAGVLGVQT